MKAINKTLLESLQAIEPADNLELSLAKVLKAQAEDKLRYHKSLISYYQKRYGMTGEEFYRTKIENKSHGWEEEETYFDWITAQQEAEEMEREIAKLEDILSHGDD
ncbi:MAG: hypothetical protein ACE5OR_05890 [bacterium]